GAEAVEGAALEDLAVEVELEAELVAEALLHRPEVDRVQEHRAVGRRADEDRDRLPCAEREQTLGHSVRLLLRGVALSEEEAELGPAHLLLELGQPQQRADEAVLLEQRLLREADVGHADRALVAQRAVVAVAADAEERALLRAVQRAVPVVVA